MKQYAKYKDASLEWLGKVPSDWEIIKLKRVLQKHQQGYYTTEEYSDSGVKLLRITDIDDFGNVFYDKSPYVPISEKDEISFSVKKGDFLFARSGTIGRFGLIKKEERAVFASYLIKFNFHNSLIENDFLKYFFLSDYFKQCLISSLHGGANQNIHAENIKEQFLALPNIVLQRLIAKYLDKQTQKLDSLIEKRKRMIELLDEHRSAIINHAVTKGINPKAKMKDSEVEWIGKIPEHWKVMKIKRLCQVKRGASPRPIDDPKYFDDNGEYSWVRISDVTASDKYLLNTEQKLSQIGQELSVKLQPKRLFLSIAGSVGKPIITKIKCCIHDGFVYFDNLSQDNEFFYYLFLSGEMYKGLGKLGTQLNLNTDTVGMIALPVPTIAEQRQIVTYIENETSKIDKTLIQIEKEIALLQEYKTALISEAATGKIDVREEVKHA